MNERILKYHAGLLTEEEKRQFELDLKSDTKLAGEYEHFLKKMNDLKNDAEVETDELYFRNLVPNVRAKLEREAKPKRNFIPALSFSLSALLIFVVLNFVININETFNSDLILTNSKVLEEYFNNPVDEESMYIYSLNENGNSIMPESLIESGIPDYSALEVYDIPEVDDYEIINYLSESDLTQFYSEMENTKILGE